MANNNDDWGLSNAFMDADLAAELAELDYEESVESREKYGIPLDRPCPWMVVLLQDYDQPGTFPLDRDIPSVVKDVKAWFDELGLEKNSEVRFTVEFIGSLINPSQDVSHVVTAQEYIAVRCAGFGSYAHVVTPSSILKAIEGVLSESDETANKQVIEYLNAASGTKPSLN